MRLRPDRAFAGHLEKNGVGVGAVFLFFGLSASLDGSDPHHRIFGYLKVEEVMKLGSAPPPSSQPNGFSHRHPHTLEGWTPTTQSTSGLGGLPPLMLPVCVSRFPVGLSAAGRSRHGSEKQG